MNQSLNKIFALEAIMILITGIEESSIAFTKAQDSMEHGRTVSVLPSLNSRVIDAS